MLVKMKKTDLLDVQFISGIEITIFYKRITQELCSAYKQAMYDEKLGQEWLMSPATWPWQKPMAQ